MLFLGKKPNEEKKLLLLEYYSLLFLKEKIKNNFFWNFSISRKIFFPSNLPLWKYFLLKTGTEGFEPTNIGAKNRCLTTWRRPIIFTQEFSLKKETLCCFSKSSDMMYFFFKKKILGLIIKLTFSKRKINSKKIIFRVSTISNFLKILEKKNEFFFHSTLRKKNTVYTV